MKITFKRTEAPGHPSRDGIIYKGETLPACNSNSRKKEERYTRELHNSREAGGVSSGRLDNSLCDKFRCRDIGPSSSFGERKFLCEINSF